MINHSRSRPAKFLSIKHADPVEIGSASGILRKLPPQFFAVDLYQGSACLHYRGSEAAAWLAAGKIFGQRSGRGHSL